MSAPTSIAAVRGIDKIDGAALRKFVDVAGALGANADQLAACIAFESGWNPAAKNPFSGATGLIQFMPSTALHLGTTVDALSKMSALDQLDYVRKYLQPFAGRLKSLEDCYLAIFWPSAVGKPDGFVIAAKGSKVYAQNPGMNDGENITRASATRNVRAVLAAAGSRRVPVPSGGGGGPSLGGGLLLAVLFVAILVID